MAERKERVKEQIKDYALKHSAAHILASAVLSLYPKTQLAIGPPLEDGFYYDFGNLKISSEDLPKIEKKMQEIINKDLKFGLSEVDKKKAEQLLKNQPFKLDILKEIKGKITFYRHGDFIDLCEGPHLSSTKKIGAIKLTKISGAYWKGNSSNPMLTRIYGVAFSTKAELDSYLKIREEAAKRDHKLIGQKLELFMFHPTSQECRIGCQKELQSTTN